MQRLCSEISTVELFLLELPESAVLERKNWSDHLNFLLQELLKEGSRLQEQKAGSHLQEPEDGVQSIDTREAVRQFVSCMLQDEEPQDEVFEMLKGSRLFFTPAKISDPVSEGPVFDFSFRIHMQGGDKGEVCATFEEQAGLFHTRRGVSTDDLDGLDGNEDVGVGDE